jgi:hypothetical protein
MIFIVVFLCGDNKWALYMSITNSYLCYYYALIEVSFFVIRIECMHFIYASKVLLSIGCNVQQIQRLLIVCVETYLCVYSRDP